MTFNLSISILNQIKPYKITKCFRIVVEYFVTLSMASFKIILRNEQKKDGTYPLTIRVTKDRKSTYIYLDYSIKDTDWDEAGQVVKKSHPNSARLNNYIAKKLSEARDAALELETN